MRVAVVGGGPAGLYFSALMKKADPAHRIDLFERNRPDATFGWGVVFSEETLGAFRDADAETYTEITETFARWGAIDIRYGGETVRSRGHVFSAIARTRLLAILQGRCRDLGVDMRFEQDVADPAQFDGYDLVVGADGVNSTVRQRLADEVRPSLDVHATKFVWFGTDLVFDAFTFIFRANEHGLFQVHGYPFDASRSTFIVECPETVWRRAGLDRASEEESIAYCEELFAEDLGGHRLLSNRSVWISFVTLRCEAWHAGNVVLLGDAAHTAHFTIGSGTKLAMEDAVSLAEALARHRDVAKALVDYEMERQPVVERFQEAARDSATYFENVRRYARFHPVQFAFNLLTRSGRITHLELEKRDPAFIGRVDAWFASPGEGSADPGASGLRLAPPPMFEPLSLRGVRLPNRAVLAAPSHDDAVEGMPGAEAGHGLAGAVAVGPGLVLTEPIAVSPEGRITPGTPGLYEDEQTEAWARIVAEARAAGPARLIAVLGHAGPRGATRPRREGIDRPLRSGGWSLLAASAVPFGPWSAVPASMEREDLRRVREAFVAATRRAAAAGFDGVHVHMAQGYLLASFLSPAMNHRTDQYGGSLQERMRYPLEVFASVRAAWPSEGLVSAAMLATEWIRGGFEVGDAVGVAGALREAGCDLIQPLPGQTSPWARPDYGRFYLIPASDRIRNEAGVPTLAGGNLITADEADTILAAGRADLCLLEVDRGL